MERALETLELYAHFCAATGIEAIRPVATSAIRDASNQAEFLERARERSGLEVEVLAGEAEARYGYLAAINSTTLSQGVVLDLGGGSMQLTRVEDREAIDARSWPLGAVRMTERFLPDPEKARRKQIKALREHVAARDRGGAVGGRGRAADRDRRHGPQPGRGGAARRRAAVLRHPGLPDHARRAGRADRALRRRCRRPSAPRCPASRPRAAT